jgi:hypothetical protein
MKLAHYLNGISYQPQKLESIFEKVLEYTIKKYGQQLSILLGHADGQSTFLYRNYTDHVLRPIEMGNFTCVGMDTSLAQFLGESVRDPFMGVEECFNLSVWITALMEKIPLT